MTSVRGTKQLIAKLGRIDDRVAQRVEQIVAATAINVQNDAKQNLVDNGSVVTATLKNSILAKKDPSKPLTYRVGTPVEYAAFVEYGTVRSRPKPYLEPALRDNAADFKKKIKKAVKDGVRSV